MDGGDEIHLELLGKELCMNGKARKSGKSIMIVEKHHEIRQIAITFCNK